MTRRLLNAILFETAALVASALPLALGRTGIALLLFAALHLPTSLLLIPVLTTASAIFDVRVHGGGFWASLLPFVGVCAVIGTQLPLLIAFFGWHTKNDTSLDDDPRAIAGRSLGTFAVASLTALLVVVVCLLLTPVCSRSTCIPLRPDEPPRRDHWQLYANYTNTKMKRLLYPFTTLRNQAFSTSYQAWWGFLRFHSPWRFAMLGSYMMLGLVPAWWIVFRRRAANQRMASDAAGASDGREK